jgi:hypothetical protein
MTRLQTIVACLVDLSQTAERRTGRSAADEVLGYVLDAVRADLGHRRRQRELAVRLSELAELAGLAEAKPSAGEPGPEIERPSPPPAGIGERLDALERRVAQLAAQQPAAGPGIGIVHYNALADISGNLSFSLALLDRRANGVVVSFLNARDSVRVYGKPIQDGASKYRLSDEERRALELATQSEDEAATPG